MVWAPLGHFLYFWVGFGQLLFSVENTDPPTDLQSPVGHTFGTAMRSWGDVRFVFCDIWEVSVFCDLGKGSGDDGADVPRFGDALCTQV